MVDQEIDVMLSTADGSNSGIASVTWSNLDRLSTARINAAVPFMPILLVCHNVRTLGSLNAPLTVLPLRSFQSYESHVRWLIPTDARAQSSESIRLPVDHNGDC